MDIKNIDLNFMNKRLRLGLKVFLAFTLSVIALFPAHSLTLGEIKTDSFLNEPLRFSIPIDIGQAESVSTDEIRVSLASSDEYLRQGLVYPWGAGTIRLNLNKARNGRIYINGHSARPVKDLIVYLLVNVSWPNGSIQKEYSTLIDVRGLSDEPTVLKRSTPAVIQSATTSSHAVNRPVARTSNSVQNLPVRSNSTYNKKSYPGFQSTQDYVDYTVKRGDALSLIAQRLRGDVKLPLHHYIQAITKANNDAFKNGLGALEVGEVIRIPNPNLVARQQHSNDRHLEQAESGAPSQYRVKYGDSLFLIAKAFKPNNVEMGAYIEALRNANTNKINHSNFLEPGIVLNIPNPSDTAVQVAQASLQSGQKEGGKSSTSDIEPLRKGEAKFENKSPQVATDVATNAGTPPVEQQIVEVAPISDLQALSSDALKSSEQGVREGIPSEGGVIDDMATDNTPMEQEVLAAIENNLALKKEIELLKNNISNLETNVTTLKRDNQNLTANIVNFNEQQQKAPKNNNFLLWGLWVVLILLVGLCVFLFSRMRQLADTVANMALGSSPRSGVSVDNPSYAPDDAEKGFAGGVFKQKTKESSDGGDGERDYSNYDFSKSNYDYSELYDVDKLKEEIKATGSDAFVKSSSMGVIEIADAEEDLGTVREFIDSGHYQAADRLLEEFIAKAPNDIESHLLRLEVESKRGTDESVHAMADELLGLFPDKASQERIEKQVMALRSELQTQSDDGLDHIPSEAESTSSTLTGLTVDSDVYDIEELSSEKLDDILMSQQVAFADDDPQSKSDALYEVKVYMSYGHDDMARSSLDEYLVRFPGDTDALILKLELLAREQSVQAVNILADNLRSEHELSGDHQKRIDEIFKKMKEGDFTDSLGDALRSTALMDDGKAIFDNTDFIEDQSTSFLQDDKTAMLPEDELEVGEDELLTRIREHVDDDKKS